MTVESQKIFNHLQRRRDGWTAVKELTGVLGLRDDRSLRGSGEDPGLLNVAAREIFETTGTVLIVRMQKPAGVRLTEDPKLVKEAKQQWDRWLWPIKEHRIDFYDRCLARMKERTVGHSTEEPQMGLGL